MARQVTYLDLCDLCAGTRKAEVPALQTSVVIKFGDEEAELDLCGPDLDDLGGVLRAVMRHGRPVGSQATLSVVPELEAAPAAPQAPAETSAATVLAGAVADAVATPAPKPGPKPAAKAQVDPAHKFKCPDPRCSYAGGPTRGALSTHARSHHKTSLTKLETSLGLTPSTRFKVQKIPCGICDDTLESTQGAAAHRRIHHKVSAAEWKARNSA